MWEYNHMISLTGLVAAAKAGCRNAYEVAEYLDVTEEYLMEALAAYRRKYGTGKAVDNYWITFVSNLQIFLLLVHFFRFLAILALRKSCNAG